MHTSAATWEAISTCDEEAHEAREGVSHQEGQLLGAGRGPASALMCVVVHDGHLHQKLQELVGQIPTLQGQHHLPVKAVIHCPLL